MALPGCSRQLVPLRVEHAEQSTVDRRSAWSKSSCLSEEGAIEEQKSVAPYPINPRGSGVDLTENRLYRFSGDR
jgi:hypothetical protein